MPFLIVRSYGFWISALNKADNYKRGKRAGHPTHLSIFILNKLFGHICTNCLAYLYICNISINHFHTSSILFIIIFNILQYLLFLQWVPWSKNIILSKVLKILYLKCTYFMAQFEFLFRLPRLLWCSWAPCWQTPWQNWQQ